jgi:hypothetical protein
MGENYILRVYDDENKILFVKWDNTNKVINSFMNEEITPYNYPDSKYNCLWISELKKIYFLENRK